MIRSSEDGQFRIYSWDTRTGGANHVFDAYYDTDDEQLHLTIVKADGTVTRQIVTYQFTGKYFELVKNR